MLHFLQRRCLNRPFRLYRALSSTASLGTQATRDAESRSPPSRSPFTRSLYIYDLPEDYDPTAVVGAIAEEPIHRVSLGKDDMYVNFWSPSQASRVLNRTSGTLSVQGWDSAVRFNKSAQDMLTASSVAHLGIAHTTRAIFVFGESVQNKSLEEWRELALLYGPLEYIRFGKQKDDSTFLVITFLSSEHARKAMSGLKNKHTVKYRRDFEASNKPDVMRRVLLSGLSPNLSTPALTNHVLDTIASVGHGEKIIKFTRSGPKIGKAVIDFTLPSQAKLFYESFRAANTNPYGLTVELQPLKPINPFLHQAIHCGASRTIRLYTEKDTIPREKLVEDFKSLGRLTQVFSKQGIALITFGSLFDALKAISDLTAGRHGLNGYEGLPVSFAKNDLQVPLKSATIASGISFAEVDEEAERTDPADIIANVVATETSPVDVSSLEQASETTPAPSEVGETASVDQDVVTPAEVAVESPAVTEPVSANSSS
ncbi:hypothetical protein IW261DRAFT_1449355 [Armillaria novae-zelandiae]|uniref:RRM domain-containing protein n=1 Tax=Armillaria novae-zelandiae TaxID=153914 RepID=A0AA39UHI4_9AGAR|nr:hypothetical protein IW261DRAFT_1449355 [Armillaria novae-zelandiae]